MVEESCEVLAARDGGTGNESIMQETPAKEAAEASPWWERDRVGSATFATWFSVSVFLVSFGILVDGVAAIGGSGEPKAATAMLALGFCFGLWSSIVYLKANWALHDRPAIITLVILVVLFLLITIWLGVRIWIDF